MKPIGYWLKHLDELIDTAFEAALGDVQRREWQVLNVLAVGETDEAGVVAALRPFSLEGALERLVGQGWVEGRYALTAA
ncbi:MAG: MarR family transcriptional regulator, partial [Umezawaea sp.]